MQIVSFPEEAAPRQLRAQVLDLQNEAWPSDGGEGQGAGALTHDPALRPCSVLLVDGPVVLAALDILSKEIVHAGRRLLAGGLSTVVTRRSARGLGHGRQLVSAARQLMADQGLDIGLFSCDRPLQGFYESAGWQLLPGAVLIGGTARTPFPSDRPGFDKVTMADFFSPAGRQAGPSFPHSRIELYPGEIDKLW
ncbi:aminoglycoside 2'-N-acetyltransferase I [Kitasatospora sp. GP30]|uniref:GNAT family N-acetyltransferase n=1 Tax=Kitasatospora sp. GP30 TaxID=3035084 RepID=UPI000C709BF9|nr:GNAT family N-acetyltransferase [Kitasatospora sp. GP30]MDH6139345.1 aminoglycoside 2'-N-acetyltransferase I [Kitasatospora sp. GP30]